MLERGPSTEIELVFFDIAGRRFGADATVVARVERRDAAKPAVERLGLPHSDRRAMVIRGDAGEVQVPIDVLVGLRRVPVSALRRLPDFARGISEPSLVGFLIEGQGMLPLIDLEALVHQDCSSPAGDGTPAPGAR